MSSFTMDAAGRFPAASTVAVYSEDSFVNGSGPTRAAVTSAVVTATGTLTFSGLADELPYVAAQLQSGTWRLTRFSVSIPKPTLAETQATLDSVGAKVEEVVFAGSGGAVITDDALIQTAVNAYAGERKVMLEGDFTIADGAASITLPDYAWVEGRNGATVSKGSAGSLPAFTAYGSVGAYANLTSNVARGTRILAVATAGIAAGDWLHLRSDKSWSTVVGLEQTIKQGEQVKVESITDSGHLVVQSPLMDDYATADVSRVGVIAHRREVTFKGIRWIHPAPATGNGGLMHGRYTLNLTIENTAATEYSGIMHYIFSGIGTKVDGVHSVNGYNDQAVWLAGTRFSYAVDIAGCTQGATISNVTGHSGSNLISCDGTSEGGIPRDCTITGCTVSGRWNAGGFHTHICAERIHFVNCRGTGKFESGLFHLAGRACTVTGGGGGDIDGAGVYMQGGAESCVIASCSFIGLYHAALAGIVDAGVNNRVFDTYVENVVNYSSAFYTAGDGCIFKNNTAKPGAGKIGLSTFDDTDSWFCDSLTVIGPASIGVNYGTPGGLTPTPRVVNLVTTPDVTTPCNAADAVISRSVIGQQAAQFSGAKLIEQSADVAAPVVEGGILYAKNLASGNAGSGLYFRDTQRVMMLLGELQGTTTWNPASIADGGSEPKAVTVTGAAVGDPVTRMFRLLVAGAAAPVGVTLSAEVTAADTVTAVISNKSGGAVDLDSGAIRVLVHKW